MSWNIKTPGDYINGPLTVAGATSFQSNVGIGAATSGFGRLAVAGTAVGAGILGIDTDATRVDIQSYNKPLAINRLGNNVTFCEGGGNVGVGVAPNAWSSMLALQVRGASFACDATIHRGRLLTNAFYDGSNYKYIQTNFGLMYAQNSLDGSHVWLTAPSGSAGTNISTFNQMFGINSNGAVSLFGGNASANGVGLTFPSAQSASTDANTLDDYEEGTWTGTLTGTTTNPTTPVTATGRYTKIGRQVSIQIQFTNADTTGASGQIKVTGAPFINNSSVSAIGSVLLSSIGTFTGSPAAFIQVNTTEIELYASSSGGAAGFVTHNAGASRSLYINLTYTV